MAEKENLAQKRKVRAAHRVSVTWMITQTSELLSAAAVGGPEPAKLRQKRDALSAKAELLSKLDANILEEVDEDDLKEEIEVAKLLAIELGGALDDATTNEGKCRGEEPTPIRSPAWSPTCSLPADHSREVSPSR